MVTLFETMRARGGRVPLLERHLARLASSCAALGVPPPDESLADRVRAQALAGDLVIRVSVDRGGDRIEPRAAPADGAMRIVFSGTRHEPYPHKTTDRAVFDRARARVVPYRADEAILLTADGDLAEGCITSVFFWLGDTLCTPALDLGILPGVGRARVLELARERGIPLREGRFRRAEAQGLPIFLVNAVRGVVGATFFGDRRAAGDDRTRLMAEAFWP